MFPHPRRSSTYGPSLWGDASQGPARGAGNGAPTNLAWQREAPAPVSDDPAAREATAARKAERMARREKARKVWETLMDDNGQPGMVRIQAAEKWLDREEGKPVQKTETDLTVTVSHADLVRQAIAARAEKAKSE